VIDTQFTDNIHGNDLGNTFFLSGGDDSVIGGGGHDTFYFTRQQTRHQVHHRDLTRQTL